MTTTKQQIDLLNKVQSFLIEQANARGICLADDFATPEDFKKFVVGIAFKGLRDAGADVATSYDACFGEGSYTDLAGKTYDQMEIA
jgi:hypothetical protein